MTTPLSPLASVGPSFDWYLTRSTGAVALLLLSSPLRSVSSTCSAGHTPRWPRFVVDGLHRNVSLLALVFLVLHILTAVLDTFAPISLLAAFVPFVSSYRPFWLGLGAVAFDLLLAVILTSLLRVRVGARVWRAAHWLVYACWPSRCCTRSAPAATSKSTWLLALSAVCLALVLTAVLVRTLGSWAAPARVRGLALGGCRRLHGGPPAVAALRAARLGMGAALRDPRLAVGPLLRGPLLLPPVVSP